MQLLLKRNRLGEVLEGSDEELISRATQGDDIALYEESSAFTCFIAFANYAVSADRLSGLSLAHMAHGEFANPETLMQTRLTTIQYIYDSKNKNLLCKEMMDDGYTLTSIWANNPHYSSLAWYSSRKYGDGRFSNLHDLKAYGDQFKVRLEFQDNFKIILKPHALYFAQTGRAFTINSAAMILPTEFVLNPRAYLDEFRPLIANKSFSLVYLSINSDNLLTIMHKQRYSVDEQIDQALKRSIAVSTPRAQFEAWKDCPSDLPIEITHLECAYTILIPE